MRLLTGKLAGPILLSITIALFLYFLQHKHSGNHRDSWWLATFITISGWRLWLADLAKKSAHDTSRFLRLLPYSRLAILLAAASWGLASFILFPNLPPQKQPIFIITIAGLAAASIVSLCSHWQSAAIFLSFTLLPLALRLFFSDLENGRLLGILISTFYLVCLYAVRKLHDNIAENIRLRLRSEAHADSLKLIKERYQHIFNNSPIGILHFDTAGTIVNCNTVFAAALGLHLPTTQGTTSSLLEHKLLAGAVQEALNGGEGIFSGDLCDTEKSCLPVRVVFKATFAIDGTINGGVGILIDYTERQQFEQTIRHQASYDSLTGLVNRRMLLEHLDQEVSRALRHEQAGALLFLDLDNFKTINDSLGYQAGDQLLLQVALRLTGILRKEDTVARMGSDEFILLLPHLEKSIEKAAQRVQEVTNKIVSVLSAPYSINDNQLSVTLCVGVTLFPAEIKEAEELLRQADTAVNQAKSVGPNTIRFFRPSMQQAVEYRLQLNNDIKHAITNQELALYYQPQVTADGSIVGAEALIRWIHPVKGVVSPIEFITVAEETAVIVEIGDWVLRQACTMIKDWEEQGLLGDHQTISVNVSPREFSEPDFVARVLGIIQESGIDPRHLGIELTEGSLITSITDTIRKIEQLRNGGLKFSVDDFGTGYSSLSYLQKLPLHTLKIDRSFVNDIQQADEKVLLVELIIAMAINLGLDIIAEGVENIDQLNYLTSRGCRIFQGYYFCRPSTQHQFTQLLREGKIDPQP